MEIASRRPSRRRTPTPKRSRSSTRFALALIVALGLGFDLTACDDEANLEAASGGAEPLAYDAQFRSDSELEAELAGLCERARRRDHPLLVEFSAAWCSDCRRLQEMKGHPALAAELRRWPSITVNVGRFDRHRPLLDALDVDSIAHWQVFAPDDCADGIADWPSLARRTLEVSSGAARSLSPADLAGWLTRIRTEQAGAGDVSAASDASNASDPDGSDRSDVSALRDYQS